jgi:NAD(P)-dependent dehydrogenase (short-subunit alcohol dehydrogenase family)
MIGSNVVGRREEFGRLDVLVNNAAISNTGRLPGMSVEEYSRSTRPSNVSLDEVRAVFETNVFGVLAVHQATLPLLREAPVARIVNVSSGAGSLTLNSDPAFPWRSIFGPVYPASKTALNAMTPAMAIELESTGIKINAVLPGFTKTNLNNDADTETVEEGAREAVRVALLGPVGEDTTLRYDMLTEFVPWAWEGLLAVPITRTFALDDWDGSVCELEHHGTWLCWVQIKRTRLLSASEKKTPGARPLVRESGQVS